MQLLGRNQGITIFGHPELEEILQSLMEVGHNKLTFKLNFVPLQFKEEQIIFEDRLIEVRSFPLKHRIETCGFRIQEKPKEYKLNSENLKSSGLSLEHYPK